MAFYDWNKDGKKDVQDDFIEYNISANSGTKYTARIVNSNSSIELKFRDGTKYETRIYSDQESITCEEFEFEGKISEDTTVVVECALAHIGYRCRRGCGDG